jgi:hypothetical protein
MRTYEDIEACIADFAAFRIGMHPELKGEKNVDTVIDVGLKGYATDPTYQDSIRRIIEKYSLTRYDSIAITGTSAKDDSSYTQEELELIWAIVAQEDDQSYEGALAVISSAMNRADANYGGYGTTALAQLTADGQYCYSPKVSDPSLWQRLDIMALRPTTGGPRRLHPFCNAIPCPMSSCGAIPVPTISSYPTQATTPPATSSASTTSLPPSSVKTSTDHTTAGNSNKSAKTV